jgi:amino acid permease
MIFGGSQKTLYNLIILLILFIILALFYNVYKAKLQREDITFTYNQIKDFFSGFKGGLKP